MRNIPVKKIILDQNRFSWFNQTNIPWQPTSTSLGGYVKTSMRQMQYTFPAEPLAINLRALFLPWRTKVYHVHMLQVKRNYHGNVVLHLYTSCLAFTRAHGLQLSSALGLQSLLELHWRNTCPQVSRTTCNLFLVSILATPAMVYEMYVFPWPL